LKLRNWTMWLASVLAVGTVALYAQSPEDVVRWKVDTAGQQVDAYGTFRAHLHAEIGSGWHIYAPTQQAGGPVAMSVTVPQGQPFTVGGALESSVPHKAHDENFDMETETYEGAADFNLPVKAGAATGAAMLLLDVRYQVCNATFCLPPHTKHLSVAVQVAAGAKSAGTANTTPHVGGAQLQQTGASQQATSTTLAAMPVAETAQKPEASIPVVASGGDMQRAESQGLWQFVWLAMGMGALSLLTPCVFPMIPITVSFFTHQGGGSRASAVWSALLYAVGIIGTFTALGLALAFFFGAAGVNQLAANPWVNLLITAIFVGFALSLFGAYFLQVPPQFVARLDGVAQREGTGRTLGILLMGFTFSLTSFTCTAPFAGTLLVMASQGSWKWPLVGMLAYSAVFALPFFVLALVPHALGSLPKSGGWLNQVKVVMGLLELAAAMKFVSNADLIWHWGVFTRATVLAVWTAAALLAVLYLLGKFRMESDTPTTVVGPLRILLTLGALALTVWLASGLLGRPMGELESFLPPVDSQASTTAPSAGQAWMENDYAGALTAARAAGKPVFVDFTGYTCTNCRWMEANMFPRPEVAQRMGEFVRLRLYTDGDGALYEQQQNFEKQRFGTIALPYYALMTPAGEIIATFPGLTRNSAEFLRFLDKAPAGPAVARIDALGQETPDAGRN
jgi:thiol:disulfide interchange protein